MSVLVFAESREGNFNKMTLEAVSYAAKVAEQTDKDLVTVSIGNVAEDELNKLAQYGASRIISVANDDLNTYMTGPYAKVLAELKEQNGSDIIVMSATFNGKSLGPRLAAKLEAGIVTQVIDYPDTTDGFVVKKSVYSNKGIGYYNMKADVKILTVAPNAVGVKEIPKEPAVETYSAEIGDSAQGLTVKEVNRQTGQTPLPEAEVVISGGRGLKGPENWNMVEELAGLLNAGTACSKPVSDVGWRPHSEHVGQTGITISPNLYIAVGISGAIQHLAGVSSSKVICVVNKDPEAPFFKSADYGIVGDAFEVVPKLIEAAKKLQA